MFATLFNILINMLATLIQIICTPINALISSTLPDFNNWLITTSNGLVNIVNSMTWAVGLIPPYIREIFAFIILVEIAKHTIYLSTNTLVKIWIILDKIKFW